MSTSPPHDSPHGSSSWSDFDPAAYLDEDYGDIGAENLALLRFLQETYRALPKGGVLLDFGGGPTIYPLISAVTRVDEIHFCDYLERNLQEVRSWLAAEPAAFDWTSFIAKALELETGAPPSTEEIERRALQIRERVTWLGRCDASRPQPLDEPHAPYDVLLTNFCAESATSDRDQWRLYLLHILSLLKPGGWLVLSALHGATHYSVGDQSFPAVDISPEDLVEVLEESGFQSKDIDVRCVAADRPSRDYAGLLLAVAQKQGAPGKHP